VHSRKSLSHRELGDPPRMQKHECVVEYDHGLGVFSCERQERPVDVDALQYLLRLYFQPHSFGRDPSSVGIWGFTHVRRIEQNAHTRRFGDGFPKQGDPLCAQLGRHTGYAGNVPPWVREARDEPRRQRVAGEHDNWNRRGRPFRCGDCLIAPCHNDVDLKTDQLAGQRVHSIVSAFSEPVLDREVLLVGIAELAEALHKRVRGNRGAKRQEPNARDLLRVLSRGSGQRHRKAESDRDGEPDPPHGHTSVGNGWYYSVPYPPPLHTSPNYLVTEDSQH